MTQNDELKKNELKKIDAIICACLNLFTQEKIDDQRSFFGSDGALESIQFVSFLISIEQQLLIEFQQEVRIVSENAFSSRNSPFRNTATLREWIYSALVRKKL